MPGKKIRLFLFHFALLGLFQKHLYQHKVRCKKFKNSFFVCFTDTDIILPKYTWVPRRLNKTNLMMTSANRFCNIFITYGEEERGILEKVIFQCIEINEPKRGREKGICSFGNFFLGFPIVILSTHIRPLSLHTDIFSILVSTLLCI